MPNLFYSKDDQQFGPVSAKQLEQLAADGHLLPDDLVWLEGTTDKVPAVQVRGLVFEVSAGVPVPPPIHSDGVQTALPQKASPTEHQPPPLPPSFPKQPPQVSLPESHVPMANGKPSPSEGTKHELGSLSAKLQDAASSFAANAKAAGQLVAAHAERTKLQTVSLPSAFNALGKALFSTGRFRDELKDGYAILDGHLNAIKQLKAQAAAQSKPKNLTDKAKAAARAASDAAQVKVLEAKARHSLTELGAAAFDRFGDQAGPSEIVSPIAQCKSRVAILDQEIERLSTLRKGKVFTPKRLAIAGAGLILLIAALGIRSFSGAGLRSSPGAGGEPPYKFAITSWRELFDQRMPTILQKEGVQRIEDIPEHLSHAALNDIMDICKKVNALLASAGPPPISVDNSCAALISDVTVGAPTCDWPKSDLTFPLTFVSKRRMEKYDSVIVFKAYDAQKAIVADGSVHVRFDTAPGERVTAYFECYPGAAAELVTVKFLAK
jgi:hypothetical protein